MANRQRVLLVNGLTETEVVLKAVLERKGIQVDRIRGGRELSEARDVSVPNVIVIHTDETTTLPNGADGWQHVPRVIIGSVDLARYDHSVERDRFLQKPFQYSELVQAIERILAEPSYR